MLINRNHEMLHVFIRDKIALILPLVLYVACILATFSVTPVPYVMDGNETYSSLVHARNLLTYGLEVTSGLADESVALTAEGHPILHTHQGNFPRLPATILSAVGIDGPTGQIAFHSIVIGGFSLLLFLLFLQHYLPKSLVLLTGLLLVTDYILFFQWQLVTYRVWHFFFVALLLYLNTKYCSTKSNKYLLLSFVSFIFLFYYEITFAIWIASFVCIFGAVNNREYLNVVGKIAVQRVGELKNSVKPLLSVFQPFYFAILGVCASLISFSMLIAQIIHHMGVGGFLNDVSYTFNSRNYIGSVNNEKFEEIKNFYADNNVAFFFNFIDSANFMNFAGLKGIFINWGILYYAPVYYYIIILTASFGISLFLVSYLNGRKTVYPARARELSQDVRFLFLVFGLLAIPMVFIATFYQISHNLLIGCAVYLIIVGRFSSRKLVSLPLSAALIAPSMFCAFHWALSDTNIWFAHGLDFAASLLVSAFLTTLALAGLAVLRARTDVGIEFFKLIQFLLGFVIAILIIKALDHDPSNSPILKLYDRYDPVVDYLGRALLVIALAGLCFGSLKGWDYKSVKSIEGVANLRLDRKARIFSWSFAFSAIAATLLTFLLIPGYIYSGYLYRSSNFLTVLFIFLISFSIYVVWSNWARILSSVPAGKSKIYFQALALTPIWLVAVHWTASHLEARSVFIPNSFEVYRSVERLSEFDGEFFATNAYPLPFTVASRSSGYLDHWFGDNVIELREDGYAIKQDFRYLWLADAKTNPAYLRPRYFICYMNQSPYRLPNATDGSYDGGCSHSRVIQLAMNPDGIWPDHELLDYDKTEHDRWAIVKLDWRSTLGIEDLREQLIEVEYGLPVVAITPKIVGESESPAKLQVHIYEIQRSGNSCDIRRTLLTRTVPIDVESTDRTVSIGISQFLQSKNHPNLLVGAQIITSDTKMPEVYSAPITSMQVLGHAVFANKDCASVIANKRD